MKISVTLTSLNPFWHAQGLRIVDLYAKKGVDTSRLYIKVSFFWARPRSEALDSKQWMMKCVSEFLMSSVVHQIASTWEGIRACEVLQKQGIQTNMTLLFSFGQVHPTSSTCITSCPVSVIA